MIEQLFDQYENMTCIVHFSQLEKPKNIFTLNLKFIIISIEIRYAPSILVDYEKVKKIIKSYWMRVFFLIIQMSKLNR